MEYTIKLEGQDIAVPEEIGASDELLTRALAPVFPGVANAQIKRILDPENDQHTIVEVIKRAGTKGNDCIALQHLIQCKGGMNPAIQYYMEHQENVGLAWLTPSELEATEIEISHAVEEGKAQGELIQSAHGRLVTSQPQRSPFVPEGF
jgi:hypothetical protein